MGENDAGRKHRLKKTVWLLTAGLLVCVCLLFLLFYNLTQQYQKNSAYSSASHLIEINRQGKTNIEAYLKKDQSAAENIVHEVESGGVSDETALFSCMEFYLKNWGEDDIYLYTEDGQCLNRGGIVLNNGTASQIASETIRKGTTFRIIRSQTEYAVAVHTQLKIRGSRLAVISVIHNLDTLIDDIGLESFGGQGSIYLTRSSGVKICQSGGGATRSAYNLLSTFEQGKLQNLKGDGLTADAVMAAGAEGAFLFRGDGPAQYVILTPVPFLGENLYLFNIVPQAAVNQTMTEFSRNVVMLSGAVIFLVILLFAAFFLLYRRRARRFDADLRSWERLFDLLVAETKNAFMLLETGRRKPNYVSSNLKEILRGNIRCIEKIQNGYRLTGDGSEDGKVLSEINRALAGWNGREEFVSRYIPYETDLKGGYLRLSLYPVASGNGEFIGVVQDATTEYRREKDLRDALTLADSANRAKTRFLSSISHDIRTPLNAIINMTRFLQRDFKDNTQAEERLNVVEQSSEHLLRLINDVLDLSRIESGKFSFADSPFQMEDTLRGVCEIIRPLCEAKGQKFQFTASVRHPCLSGDALRLNQILINILNNAVKFTPEHGSVEFSAEELSSIKSEEIPFRFTVRDNGIGIPEEKLSSIFDPFSRVETDAVRQTEGSGLGLAITKRFVDALGGTISVSSTVGKGTVFAVELTYRQDFSCSSSDTAEKAAQALPGFRGKRALLVEDNAINVEIAVLILSEWGVSVETAENGSLAVEMFRSHPSGHYDIVYMDIQMPVMDGYSATAAIRSSGKEDAQTIPIIAMTANAFAEDVERARTAGMNAHISKPINVSELHQLTAKLLAEGEKA